MNLSSFFAELKRRNVLRAAAFYTASAWLLVQVATQVFPFFHIDEWVVRWVVVAACIGFPFAVAFSWFYEWTPRGLQRESEMLPHQPENRGTGKKLDRWIIAILALSVVLLLTNQFVWHKDTKEGSAVPDKSIAVLPLANESGANDEQYFSDGLSEDFITALSQFAGLKVIGRSSSFQFRDSKDDSKTIGAKLGVAHLLEGSVRRAGDAVRVSAELIRAVDGTTVWSQHYDRPYKDLFKLQDEITSAVANELRAKLATVAGAVLQTDRPPSGNLAAYNAYLQGKFYFQRNTTVDFNKAAEFFHEAIRLDPDYAQAYAMLAMEKGRSASGMSAAQARQAYAAARGDAEKALLLDPNLAFAHDALGFQLLWADFNWAGAESEMRRAAELAPNDHSAAASLGQVQATLGHPERALESLRQAIASDSLNVGWYFMLSQALMPLGRLKEAEQVIRKAIEVTPTNSGMREQLATIQVLRGDAAGALATAMQTSPGMWHDIALAEALQIGSDHAAADAALKALIDGSADTAAVEIAETYALRNDPDKMFEWLDRAWANRDAYIDFLLSNAFLLRFKDDPRFAAFCRKVGLPTPAEIATASKS